MTPEKPTPPENEEEFIALIAQLDEQISVRREVRDASARLRGEREFTSFLEAMVSEAPFIIQQWFTRNLRGLEREFSVRILVGAGSLLDILTDSQHPLYKVARDKFLGLAILSLDGNLVNQTRLAHPVEDDREENLETIIICVPWVAKRIERRNRILRGKD